MQYTSNMTMSKVFGFAAAVAMTVAVNGSLLWSFDDVSQRAVTAPALMASVDTQAMQHSATRVTLPAVTIHAHKA